MKILVADDDAVSLRLMERTLRRCGYEVMTVGDGRKAAYELAKVGGPRLALIDWMMPELDGPGVCREVRSRQDAAYTYMLLLTSKQTSEDVVAGLEAGADDYLTKPCHAGELQARLHTGRRILRLEDRLVEARDEMRFKATHDALTSLWDRGAILSLFRGELSRSQREAAPLSLLLCDIDHFKGINDVHGHPAGDEVLEEVAKRLQRAVRAQDAVGRYGGEEFLVVMTDCSGEDLRQRAEEVRIAVGGAPFRIKQGTLSVTLSVGATVIENGNAGQGMEAFLKEADVALYRAKASGRDRVVCAEPAYEAV